MWREFLPGVREHPLGREDQPPSDRIALAEGDGESLPAASSHPSWLCRGSPPWRREHQLQNNDFFNGLLTDTIAPDNPGTSFICPRDLFEYNSVNGY